MLDTTEFMAPHLISHSYSANAANKMNHFILRCQEKQNQIATLIHPSSVYEVFEGDQQ